MARILTLVLQIPTFNTMKLTNSINKADKHEKRSMLVPFSLLKSADFKMKRIFYLFLVLPLILLSCESTPEAHFLADTVEPEVGQEVLFTNDSHNATSFEWDFGDGYVSSEADPVHHFTASGSFEVVLTAFSRSGLSDKASITIDVKIPTLLEIEVVEWYQEYDVAGASVRLYPTLVDWEAETNMETEGFTDEDGLVVFSNLGPYVYYVDVWEQNHDNYTLKTEDIGFIRTGEIMPHKINRFVAWVDYVEHTKSDGTRDRTMVIKKLERKPTDKSVISTESEDWKTLYDKSIKVK
jgi:PKD repeat protein